MFEAPKLTDRQQQILDLVQSAIERTGAPPTRAEIAADVRQGTRRDALLFAAGANSSHGLSRTTADKRRAIE